MMYKQQHVDHFIGRTQEIDTFTHWLADPSAPWILYIHDALEEADKKGGVGKTRLIRRCADLTRQTNPYMAVVMVDFFNTADRDRVFLAEKIIANLQELYPHWSPSAFTEAVQQYRTEGRYSSDQSSADSDEMQTREAISTALAQDLRLLNTYLIQENKTLLIFFDTFEVIEQTPTVASLRQSQTFPDNYQLEHIKVVIAGRNKLDWTHTNWRGREQEVQVMALAPFSPQETQEYVQAELIYDLPSQSAQAAALYERTEGRPIVIGLAIDVLNHGILTVEDMIAIGKNDFEAYLVPQVNKLEEPLNWAILFMAHVYHRFNMPILETILQGVEFDGFVRDINREELATKLPQLSFVRRATAGEDFVLHDEMRRLVTKYCWEIQDPGKRFRKSISHCVIDYYEQQELQTQNDQQKQTLIIETLYHRLFVDPDDGLRYFSRHFGSAIRARKRAFARLLFQEIQKFTALLSPAQLGRLQIDQAILLRIEDNATAVIETLQQLKEQADPAWYEENLPLVLMEEGKCYQRLSRLPEAANSFIQCLAMQQARGNELQCAHLLHDLGLIFLRRGQFAESLDYYERSIALYKKLGRQSEYATALNSTSFVYRLQGKIEEALRRCKIAWRIRRDLFREEKVSEDFIGFSLQTLGGIYLTASNVIEAERCFHDAYDIYQRTNNKHSIATIYNRFGQVQILKGELEGAKEWFIKAQQASKDINEDQYITSLNRQGYIYTLQQQWKEAIPFFEEAVDRARKLPDYYHQTENLIELATALHHLGSLQQVQSRLQEAEAISIREKYFNLLGQVEQMRGEIDYHAKDYPAAFLHFAAYCHDMAIYNDSEFKIAVRKVVDALLGVPESDVPSIVQKLLSYWTKEQLDTKY
ncbi:MAG TPA: tetratricopeptide repeat protein, partial [Ktedonobacteraceae bacterium]|nr:tetratricopeptide repeat protein [Ktedonobacteraceae bacterium]